LYKEKEEGGLPESVQDRCTRSHEYLFLLTKNKNYYYNADAIKEPYIDRISQDLTNQKGTERANGGMKTNGPLKALGNIDIGMKNKRDVWWISPASYKGSHFAVFPKDLVQPCILAGSKEGDIVLDPFAGSGTVGEVSNELGRKFILLELNEDYLPLINERVGHESKGFF
jgi:DNA modification methylase